VIGGGLKMTAWGIAAGVVAVAAASWPLTRYFDALTLGWAPIVLSVAIVTSVSVAAASVPAWRATQLSPMIAIRDEPSSAWHSARESIRRTVQRISHAVLDEAETDARSEGALLADLVGAVRRSQSFPEALRAALATLCRSLNAESAMLLERQAAAHYQMTAAVPEFERPYTLPADGVLVGRLTRYELPLPLRPADLETMARWAEEHRPERTEEIRTLATLGARLAVALRSRREIPGLLLLGSPVGRMDYSAADRRLLRAGAAQLALLIENGRLTDRIVEQEKLRRDLALAAEVQKRLLPHRAPDLDAVSLAAVSVPARSVGGDYYDFIEAGDRRIGIALADVAGKGVAAALIMSVVQASLRILSSEGELSLPQLAAKMNQFLHRATGSNGYATFFYAQLDTNSRTLRYVNAGHLPPYLLRSTDGCVQELSTGGAVIGLFPALSYQEATVELQPGDVLVAFTDGVTEALNAADEEYGEERLKNLLREVVHLPVQEISSRMSDELRSWINDAPQYDDLTFVVMKVNGEG
jgi:serine phosphatase RsbU (regulator of sigma subunit)